MKLWLRNTIFLCACVGVATLTASRLMKDRVPAMRSLDSDVLTAPDFRNVIEKVDAAFATNWLAAGLTPAGPAPELTLARRLSLALTGTIPSLEEIRSFESQPPDRRIQSWLTRLFADRRSGDFLAERLARALVGVEGGPFIVFRRHRMVSWLSDQIMANQPYDQIARSLITAEGLWTSRPEVNFITVTVDQNDQTQGPTKRN